jgi:hypothetical protein
MAQHLVRKRRDFRKIRACPDDIQDFQALAHGAFVSGVRRQYNIRVFAFRCGGYAVQAKKALVQCMRIGIRRGTCVK